MSPWTGSRLGAIVNGCAVLVALNMLPVLAGALAHALSLNSSQIGLFASAETVGIALGALAVLPVLRNRSSRAVAMVGVLVVFSADVVSYFESSIGSLIIARAAGGIGAGVTLGVCFELFAESDREMNFAFYSIGQTALALVAIVLVPATNTVFGWQAMFLLLAIPLIPALILVRYFPAGGRRLSRSGSNVVVRSIAPRVWLALWGVCAFFLGQGALWTFLEIIGVSSGISERVVQNCLAVCAAFGLLGSSLIVFLGLRVRPWIPLIASLLLTMLGVSAVGSTNPWIFGAAISAFYFSLPIFAAYQFGAIVAADDSKRAAPLISAATFGGFAVAPYLGAQIVSRFGYISLQVLDVTLMVASLLTLLPLFSSHSDSLANEVRA